MRVLSPHRVAQRGIKFILNKIVRQTRHGCHDQHQKQTEPKRAIAINLKLHAVVMSLREEIEHEFRVKDEVEDEVKQDASPDEKVIDPRPVLREKGDLKNTINKCLKFGDSWQLFAFLQFSLV